jgi:hypothetical protein
MQNLRHGHYEHGGDLPVQDRVRVTFTDLAYCL